MPLVFITFHAAVAWLYQRVTDTQLFTASVIYGLLLLSLPCRKISTLRRPGEVLFTVTLCVMIFVNALTGTLKPHSNGPLYSNTVISTLAVDGWAATFSTARRGLGGLWPRPVSS